MFWAEVALVSNLCVVASGLVLPRSLVRSPALMGWRARDVQEPETQRLRQDTSDYANGAPACYNESAPQQPRRKLTFIHIPRTGGTTIEDCTVKDRLEKWGHASQDLNGLHALPAYDGRQAHCYKQHIPPAFLPEIYKGKETFCVVRNPYARMISQFGFKAAFFKTGPCNRDHMNEVLRTDLLNVKNNRMPYDSDCHYLPQGAFAYRLDPETMEVDTGSQICNHVLHTEKLEEEFNDLARSHGYPYELHRIKAGLTKSSDACQTLGVADLSEEVRHLIEEIYAVDFRLFGYHKL